MIATHATGLFQTLQDTQFLYCQEKKHIEINGMEFGDIPE